MIVFDLLCDTGHRFEGWFASAEDFAAQKEQQLLSCPSCGSASITRVPSASRVNLGAPEPRPAPPQQADAKPQPGPQMDPIALAHVLYSRMLDQLIAKTEDVGKAFPEEARKIYYEEAPARPIRGQATEKQHQELLDEGIPVVRLPIPPRDRLN